MKHLSTQSYRWLQMHVVPFIALSFFLIIGIASPATVFAQQGVAPTETPSGGFAVDGNLLARTPDFAPFSADDGDFLPNESAAGSGGYVFTLTGLPLDTLTAFHIIDEYDAADMNIFTEGSKFNMDPNDWVWKSGKPTAKDDMNHVLFFFSSDSLGNIWFVGAGDRKKPKGNTYLDFELLQNPLYLNDSSFTSLGPDGGRTIGDLAITMEFTNGGIQPGLHIYRWDVDPQGGYDYFPLTPADGTTYLAANNDSAVVVPYGAFGEYIYPLHTYTEVAININEVMPGSYECMGVKTVIAKTKASHSINAVLKDFIHPVQVDINSAPVISVNDTAICQGDSATLTVNVISGNGPFSYLWNTGDTTQSITVSPDTTTHYTIIVTGINGCPSPPDTATVTVTPLPACFINGPDTICPLATEQYYGPDTLSSYAWTISGSAVILGDTNMQMVEVQGTGSCDSSFILELIVMESSGCSSTCTGMFYIVDTLPPVFTDVPDTLMLQCASTVPVASIDSVTVSDNCVGDIVVMVSDSISNDSCPNQFNIFRTWIATDPCGNTATASQYISVFDSIPPVLYGVPADTGVCCADSIPLPANVTAIDSCDGSLAVTLTEVVSDSTSPLYFTLTRIWTATDICSNMATDTMVIEVNDTLYPAGGGTMNISDPDAITLYFTVAPNPFSNSTNITFSLKMDADVSLALYNYTGIKVKEFYSRYVSAGDMVSVQLSPEANMQSGMYLLVLQSKYGIETRSVILKR